MSTTRKIVVAALAAAFAFACASSGVSEETKHQQTTQKNVTRLKEGINDARTQLGTGASNMQKAIDDYNSIVEGRSTDPRKTYGDLVNRVADLEKNYARTRDSYNGVYNRAQGYFNGWKAELDTYTNPDLKVASEERYNNSKAAFEATHAELITFTDDYETFLSNLSEQTRFLGRDLSAEAVAVLDPQKEALNQQARDLVDRAGRLGEDLRIREESIAGTN